MALPKDVTVTMGTVSTDTRLTATLDPTQPFEISRDIRMWNPKKYQLLNYIFRIAPTIPTTASRFFHQEESHLTAWVKHIGVDEAGTQLTTDLLFENGGKRLAKYSRIRTPLGENILFKADFDSDGYTSGDATRNFGTSGTPDLKPGDMCKIMSTAFPENSTRGSGPVDIPLHKSFRTGIIREEVALSGTKAAEKFSYGDPFEHALNKTMDVAMDKLEAGLIYGAAVDDDSTYSEGPLHTWQGIDKFIATNRFSIAGLPSRQDFWNIVGAYRQFYKGKLALACSTNLKNHLCQMAFNKVVYDQDLTEDGIDIDTILTPSGRVTLLEVDMLSQAAQFAGEAFFIPDGNVDYRPLVGIEDRDIQYIPNDGIRTTGVDTKFGTILGEIGLELYLEQEWCKLEIAGL